MDLAELLTDHVAVAKFQPNNVTNYDAALTSVALDEDQFPLTAGYTAFIILFNFANGCFRNGEGAGTIEIELRYPTYNYMRAVLEINNSQSSASVIVVRIGFGITGGMSYTSTFNVYTDQNYALVLNLRSYATIYWSLAVDTVSDTGVLAQAPATPSLNSSFNPTEYWPDRMRLYFRKNNCSNGFRIYEPIILAHSYSLWGYQDAIPRLWHGMRRLTHSYYSGEFRWFLLPPFDIMDGCAYDRSVALSELLDDAQTVIDELNVELSEGGNVFDWLSDVYDELTTGGTIFGWLSDVFDQLNAGGTIFDWLSDVFDQLSDGGTVFGWLSDVFDELKTGGTIFGWLSDVFDELKDGGTVFGWLSDVYTKISTLLNLSGDKLTHLKNIVSDPVGALQSNFWRILKQFLDDRRDLPE